MANDLHTTDAGFLDFEALGAAINAGERVRRSLPRPEEIPLSHAQQRLWFLYRLDPTSTAYNTVTAKRFSGPLDFEWLRVALERVVARHEILRTTFHDREAGPVQVINETASVALEWETAVDRPFVLDVGPLVRCRLHVVSPDVCDITISMPHIVCDGWSIPILWRELAAFYRGLELEPLQVQFADVALFQRDHANLESSHRYWHSKLLGAPPTLLLPTDHRRNAGDLQPGAVRRFVLAPALSERLKAIGKAEGCTCFMTVLAAFNVLLYRWSGQDDVVVGSAAANRLPGFEQSIGFFVSTLCLRVDLGGAPSFRDVLRRVRSVAVEGLAHQDVAFDRLVKELNPVRDATRHPLFQVMFSLQNVPEDDASFGDGLETAVIQNEISASMFDLVLSAIDTDDGLHCELEYATALFSDATIERMAHQLEALCLAIVNDPEKDVRVLNLLPPTERELVVETWNETRVTYPQESCLHALFEAQVELTPDAIALEDDTSSVTYRDLNAQANRVAHALVELGIGPDQLVGLCVERHPRMVAALLGILKAGGAYVPLDLSYPAQRLHELLGDALPGVVLVDPAGRAALGTVDVSVLMLDELLGSGPTQNPCVTALSAANLAYVMYTSGSTGRPKGVMVEHRNVVNYVTWARGAYDLDAGSILTSSLSFDATITTLWTPLLHGTSVKLVPEAVDLDVVAAAIARSAGRLVKITPTHLDVLAASNSGQRTEAPAGMFVVGGEALSTATVRSCLDGQWASQIVNEYGPTETVVGSVVYRVGAEQVGRAEQVPIGRPIANTQIYLLDPNREPVPVGVVGEIYIGGAGVARGYLRLPELTADRFLRDPFSADSEARMYRTGDLARYLPDANLEFLGRNDDQVKIRGYRIEPGEIEGRMRMHPSVRNVAVLPYEAAGDRRLVAYVVAVDAGDDLSSELREHLAAQLPAYMVPSRFVQLDALPLTSNGKVDRKALSIPPDGEARREYVPPLGTVEVTLAALWAELLNVARVGRHDQFFELGGHSLLAIRLVNRVRKMLSADVSVGSVLLHSTFHEFASVVERSLAISDRTVDGDQEELSRVGLSKRDGARALSFGQQRLWFLARLDPESSRYHMWLGLRLRGPLDVIAWRRSLDRIVERHEVLRSVFVSKGGAPLVTVLEQGFALTEDNWEHRADREEAVAAACESEARAAFDLERGPLIRGRLIRLGAEEHVFVLAQHHIVSDGWSLGVFTRELNALYRAFQAGQPDPLAPLRIQYSDFAEWQRQWLDESRRTEQSAYWRQVLANAPTRLSLPMDRPRPAEQSFEGSDVKVRIDAQLTQALKRLSQQHGTTVFMTVLAAWAVVLSRLSGETDLVIGVPTANRSRLEVESLIGFFLNTLAVRIDLSREPSARELLHRIREATLAAQDHQDLPFEQVMELVQPPRRRDHTPIFQVMCGWQTSEEGDAWSLPGVDVTQTGLTDDLMKFDLELNVVDIGDEIVGELRYATALFDRSTIERHCGYLLGILHAMASNADESPMRADMLDRAERRLLLETWNETEESYPAGTCLHALFEARVAQAPDAVAVVQGEETLTYGELNARANRVAHALIARGVGPDRLVGLCTERNALMVVGLLGILKAGGAYVPLDPSYPLGRLADLVRDAAPELIVADGAGQAALRELDARIFAIDQLVAGDTANPVVPGLASSHLAYVIYTSGSTGRPKGVMVEHEGATNRVIAIQRLLQLDCDDVVLQRTTISFDVSVWEVFGTLLCGATLVLAPDHRDISGFGDQVAKYRATTAHLVPAAVMEAIGTIGEGPTCPLRNIVCSGEALSPDSARALMARLPSAALFNIYGPSEAPSATALHFNGGVGATVSIGRPTANTHVYVLDHHGKPVPTGVAGELFISGAGVARGYLNRQAETSERFGTDPFEGSGSRMYRTGDLGRWLPDGTLEFLGRNDDQVKIRGYRIELGEIEARLRTHPGVREAVVTVRAEIDDKRLVAYVVARAGDNLASSLREHLAGQLPEYLVPSAFVQIEALPLSPTGKLDRRALPAPDDRAVVQRGYEAPQGHIERALATIWSELLGVERVGRHDHFFELGGHSLLIVKLLERLRDLGLGTEVRTLFTTPKLSELAATFGSHHEVVVPPNVITPDTAVITPAMLPLIELNADDIAQIVAHVPGGVSNIQDIYALSPLQEGILFHHILATEGDPYLVVGQTTFADRDRLDRYLEAVRAVAERHDILRTAFVWEALSRPAQVVWRKAPLSVTEIKLDTHQGMPELVARFDPRRHRIALTEAPLLRYVIAREPTTSRWLMLQIQHHLIGDHSTLDVLEQEIATMLAGRAHQLATPHPFRNEVAQVRLGVSAEEHEAFFRKLLADIREPTTPFGITEVHGDGRGVTELRCHLPVALNDELRAHARRLGVSLASLCHVAWGQVLARTSGRDQVVFGTVLFGRMHSAAGVDRAMGLYINTLPIRIDLDDTGVEQSVRRTHALLAELLRHEHASLALAQRCSGVAAPAPLFSALLNYRHTRLNGLENEWVGEERSNYPVVMSVEDYGDGLGLTGHVDDTVPVARVCQLMERALESLAYSLQHAPTMAVRLLDVLPTAERRLLLETWNATEESHPAGECIHTLFEARVAQAPDAVAVVHGEDTLTYGELNARANRVAHALIARGVGPDRLVGLCTERNALMIVGLLGILKAGGAYVPLDPSYPTGRLADLVRDAAPEIIVADGAGQVALREIDAHVFMIDEIVEGDTANPVVPRLASSHLAYVIYTSGSTGQPKGVMVEHAQVARLFDTTHRHFLFNERDVWCLFHSFAFDFSVWELWGALSYGARLVIVSREIARSPQAFYELVCDEGVTVLNQTPSAFRGFIEARRQSARRHHLRYVIFGGELLEPSMLRSWYARERNESPQLVNMYGITETTVHVTYRALTKKDVENSGSPIGRPIADLRCYLLDQHGVPVPIGAIGEIYVGGAGVARGYLHRAELTTVRFVRDPFAIEKDARMYRTGDLARYLPDGNLEFLGRNDQQVKVRGHRIELGEIETRLRTHPEVRDAVVVVREEADNRRLVAYVISSEQQDLIPNLREFLSLQLPAYMVPSAFVQISKLPLNANGKLDRAALPVPSDAAVLQQVYEAPHGPTEIALAALWCELLGVERVGRHDQFFELGGHSLLAVQLMERLRRLGMAVDVRTLFATPTLSALAATLGSHHEVAVPANAITAETTEILPSMLPLIDLTAGDIAQVVSQVPDGVSNIQDIYSLSPLQEGILFHHVLAADGDPYLLMGRAVFVDRAHLDRYLEAVQAVVDRHDILRTSFMWQGLSTPAQIVWRKATLRVTEVELEHGEGAEQLLERFDPRHYRMDLSKAPLFRYVIAKDPGGSRWLMLQFHHHLVDDNSTIEAIESEIEEFLAGRGSELPHPQPFRNVIAQSRLGISAADHEAFFRRQLGDIDEPTTPFGLVNVHGGVGEVERARQQLPQALSDELRMHARRLGVTFASLFHVAWGQVVSRTTGREHVVFGTVLVGRMHGGEGADRAMGMYINTLPIRLDLDSTGIEQCVRRTHLDLAELLRHEHASLALAQRCSGVSASAPLFSALLNYRRVSRDPGERSIANAGMEWTATHRRTNYPIVMSIDDHGYRVGLSAQAPAIASAKRVCELMLTALESLAHMLSHAPSAAVRSLEVLSKSERKLLVETWNTTSAPYPAHACVHELFEAQARKSPKSVALIHAETSLRYEELDARSNLLANRLIALGVTRGVLVGICAERGLAQVVALLAILKAGAAYVPLDPGYPLHRLTHVVLDSKPLLCLVDKVGLQVISALGLQTLALDDAWSGEENLSNPRVEGLTASDLAYVIYTSGSTGVPKGVMIEHRSVVNFLTAMARQPGCTPDNVVMSVTTLSFDISLLELVLPLTTGATCVIASRAEAVDGKLLSETMRRYGVTMMQATPTTWRLLLSSPWKPDSHFVALVGGEALPPDVASVLSERGCEVWNMYGPTETTVWSTIAPVRGGPINIGRPIANTRVYVLDGNGRPVPRGVSGQLYIGGAGVARGYWHRAELTEERFVDESLHSETRCKMYATGDVVRYLPDGELEFLGRSDQQIKLRGHRIELGEVQSELLAHHSLQQAVVRLDRQSDGEGRLVAYVVPRPGDWGDLARLLREHLVMRVPSWMIPTAFVQIESVPLTPNGKLDTARLPQPANAAKMGEGEEPTGEIEIVLANIWKEVLPVQRVGRADHFFEAGGHSILAMKVVSRVRECLGCDVSIRTIFQRPTFGDFADSVVVQMLESTVGAEESKRMIEQLSSMSDAQLSAMLETEVDN